MSIYILEARRKKSKNVNHIDINTMRVGSNSVSDEDIERQEDIHRDEGYLLKR